MQKFLEYFIPVRKDHKKHIIIGVWACIGYLPIIVTSQLKYVTAFVISYYVAYGIATALYELWQGWTGKGEKNPIDWLFGMLAPTICLSALLLLISKF